jgi:hypothetical protein
MPRRLLRAAVADVVDRAFVRMVVTATALVGDPSLGLWRRDRQRAMRAARALDALRRCDDRHCCDDRRCARPDEQGHRPHDHDHNHDDTHDAVATVRSAFVGEHMCGAMAYACAELLRGWLASGHPAAAASGLRVEARTSRVPTGELDDLDHRYLVLLPHGECNEHDKHDTRGDALIVDPTWRQLLPRAACPPPWMPPRDDCPYERHLFELLPPVFVGTRHDLARACEELAHTHRACSYYGSYGAHCGGGVDVEEVVRRCTHDERDTTRNAYTLRRREREYAPTAAQAAAVRRMVARALAGRNE